MTYSIHAFTDTIINVLDRHFGENARIIFDASDLLKYLNFKTKAANRDSKSRASYASFYAIYVLVEDYVSGGFDINENYRHYEGAQYSTLLRRQRELPFGSKLQNHTLNNRLNDEFRGKFPTSEYTPIIRDPESNRYWINENLLIIRISDTIYNIAQAIIEIIDSYVAVRQSAFNDFMTYCEQMITIQDLHQVTEFIKDQIKPNVDARIFEIVSYAVLKEYYADQMIYWGWSIDDINQEYLVLYKTGRTNANDGGIDFIMKPLGRFFQVTETVDAGKYFLDIDKVQRHPITFVVKSEESPDRILERIESQARRKYPIESVVKKYIDSIEEVINITEIIRRFDTIVNSSRGDNVMREIVLQSRVEFNVATEDEETLAFDKAEQELQEEDDGE